MDLTKALDFLEKQGLADCHYQDSGMMEHIAENMQKYADQQLILSGVSCSFSQNDMENFAAKCMILGSGGKDTKELLKDFCDNDR